MDGRRIRGVLFDFGNTLFAHPSLAATIVDAAAALGHVLDERIAADLASRIDVRADGAEEVPFERDLDSAVWAQRWSVIYGLADEVVAGLGQAIDASMHDPQQWIPYASTPAVLRELHAAGVRVGVLSNTGWDVRGPFTTRGLDGDVDAFTLSCEIGIVKPAPAIFEAACAALGVDPTETLMVGDDPRADVGAVGIGVRTLLVPPRPAGSDNGIGAVPALVAASAPTAATTG